MQQIDRILKSTILILFIPLTILVLWSKISLYADGAFWFVNILIKKSFWLWDINRIFSDFVSQFFLVTGIYLGIKNLNVLIFLYTLGFSGLQILLWFISLFFLRNSYLFWIYLLGFIGVYFGSGFFAEGEHNICFGMVALSSIILLKNEMSSRYEKLLLLILSILLTAAYPAMIFFSPLLLFLLYKAYNFSQDFFVPILYFYIISFIRGLNSVLNRQNKNDVSNALDINRYLNNKYVFYIHVLSITILIFFLLIAMLNDKININKYTVYIYFLITLIILINSKFLPSESYTVREYCGIFLFVIIVFSSVLFKNNSQDKVIIEDRITKIKKYFYYKYNKMIKKKKSFNFIRKLRISEAIILENNPFYKKITIFIFFIFIVTLFKFSSSLIQFHDWVDDYRTIINSNKGRLEIHTLMKQYKNIDKFDWEWTNPSLSLILGHSKDNAYIFNAGSKFQPFLKNYITAKKKINSLKYYYPNS